jgi:hypothetical protein
MVNMLSLSVNSLFNRFFLSKPDFSNLFDFHAKNQSKPVIFSPPIFVTIHETIQPTSGYKHHMKVKKF